MNYCFNCGARLLYRNQKFYMECGINLTEHGKEDRKKYNPYPGESYKDYLNRINSPIKDAALSEKEMENRCQNYRNQNPHEPYRKRHPEISYPKSERENDEGWTDMENFTSADQRVIIREGMLEAPLVSIKDNFIYEGIYGRPKYYIDGDIIRENNQFGKTAYRIDGKYIREGMFGKPKYYIDGDLIRENNQFGKVVGRRKK